MEHPFEQCIKTWFKALKAIQALLIIPKRLSQMPGTCWDLMCCVTSLCCDLYTVSFIYFYRHISMLCCTTTEPTVVVDSLQVMDTIIAYSYLSSVALTHSVVTLCRVVVVEEFYEPCCKVSKLINLCIKLL